MFFLLNPFVSIFIISLISTYRKINNFIYISLCATAFATFFYFRSYGVEWVAGSEDDVIRYTYMYELISSSNLYKLLSNFVDYPGQNEPLWHLFWWGVSQFNISTSAFIYAHYFLNFLFLLITFRIIAVEKYCIVFLFYFFVSLVPIEVITFLWRQELAFTMFILCAFMYFDSHNIKYKYLLICVPLIHLPSILLIALFLQFDFIQNKYSSSIGKVKIYIIIFNIILILFLFQWMFQFLEFTGLKSLLYDETAAESISMSSLVFILMYLLYFARLYLKHNKNTFETFLSFVVVSILPVFIMEPFKSMLFYRYLTYVYQIGAIYLSLYFSSSKDIYKLRFTLVIISLLGFLRYCVQSENATGVFRHLAFNNSFDPFMGIAMLLLNYY